MAVSRINEAGLNVNQYGNRNLIINGAMQVSQRGTSFTGLGGSTGAVYTLDRFATFDSATAGRATVTQDTDSPDGFSNSLKAACTTADTSVAAGEVFKLEQRIEGQNLQQIAKGTSSAKQVTVSFYVKANASATYTIELEDADNNRYNSQEFSVTTGWTRVTKTFAADTTGAFDNDNGPSLKLNIWLHAGSNFTGGTHTDNVWHTTNNQRVGDSQTSFFDSTSRTFYITGYQLEVGDTATDFEYRSFADDLARCQRYFFQMGGEGLFERFADGFNNSSTQARCVTHFPVTMRSAPSVAYTSDLLIASSAANGDVTSIVADYNNTHMGHVKYNASGASLTAGQGASIAANNSTDTRLKFEAEL